MKVGDRAQTTRSFAAADVAVFAALSGDAPPAGLVPEPMLAALFSYLLGVELPGPGTNYLKQSLRFLRPAPVGASLMARVEVTRLRPEKHLCDLATTIVDAEGRTLVEGRALVLVKDVGASA